MRKHVLIGLKHALFGQHMFDSKKANCHAKDWICCQTNSPRKQPTFCNATIGFSAKWRLRNERRNSLLMTCHYPDLGSDASSVWTFYHCSDVISCGNQWWRRRMLAVFSGYQATRNQVKCFKPLKQRPTLHVNICLTPLILQKLGGKTCHICNQSDVHFSFAYPYLELLFA